MGRKKVLHVIGGGEFGGAEQHLLTLIKHMNDWDFEIHIACLFPEPFAPLAVADGIPVYVLPMKNKLDLKPVNNMASIIKKEGFDIVHTHGIRANLIGRLASRKAGAVHVVTTVHSVLAFDYSRWFDRWVNKVCEKSTRYITERFIAVSGMLARQLVSEGIPEEKIVTIHNGLDISGYTPEISGLPVRREFCIDSKDVVLGIVARLHPVKGHSYLLEAVSQVVPENPGVKLLVVGDGPDRDKLEQLVSDLGLGKNVIFTGFRSDIPQVIAALDILVLPSLSEGLSLTIMEGMAMKKPVLATAVGGTPELITSGANGLLVPPADVKALKQGIERLVKDHGLRQKLAGAARQTVKTRFSAGLMADKTGQLYNSILSNDER